MEHASVKVVVWNRKNKLLNEQTLYNILGYKYIIVWVVLLSIVIFAFSLLIGIIYRVLFGKIIEKLAGKMIVLIDKIYKKYEKTMYKIK